MLASDDITMSPLSKKVRCVLADVILRPQLERVALLSWRLFVCDSTKQLLVDSRSIMSF
jgi:hypothetical protein